MDKISVLKSILAKAKNICVFTGAGISCPSGIPDFRSADGLYSQQAKGVYSPEEIISHSFFKAHPDIFYEFYKSKMVYPDALPNLAHKYFADLESQGKNVSIVTQNIDGLHRKAGSSNVIELHGSVLRNFCTKCAKFYTANDIMNADGIPYCPVDGAIIKPDVVLYEESLDNTVVESALNAISSSDTMLVIGTSLVVYPAASYVRYFGGSHLILINKSKTDYDNRAEISIHDDIIHVIEELNQN